MREGGNDEDEDEDDENEGREGTRTWLEMIC
jgi:hypothetical protein